MYRDVLEETTYLPESTDLENGELAIRLGATACPEAVNLKAVADPTIVLRVVNASGVAWQVKAQNEEGNGISWKRSGRAPTAAEITELKDALAVSILEADDNAGAQSLAQSARS